jgi:Ca2+-binding RTX toxin-like protein
VVYRIALLTLAATMFAVVLATMTATNTVPSSNVGSLVQSTGANDLKPSQCSGITLAGIVTGDGASFSGTGNNDLILGGPSANNIRGNGGVDCIVGGAGNDTLRGGGGPDVCIGGPGTDSFVSCSTAIQ